MRCNLRNLLVVLLTGFAAQTFAQFEQDFEPVQGQALSTRDALLQQNWLLPDMDVNPEGTIPIDGSQSLGSGPSYKPSQNTGIVTPFLSFSANEDLSFTYNIHRAVMPSCRRWFLVYIVDTSSNLTLLDSVEVDGTTTTTVNYAKNISGYAGTYCIYINFRGDGCNGRFVVDDFRFTGSNANLGFPAHLQAPATVMGINDAPSNETAISLYPNPVATAVNVQVNTTKDQLAEVAIANVSGAVMITRQATLHNGGNTINVNVNNLAPGSYFVTVKTQEGVFTKRFLRVQ